MPAGRKDDALAALPWLAVAALVAWSAWHRWDVLASSPHPVGIDGYFYAIQTRSLLETGGLEYPASPLTLWLMAAAGAMTDPITGAKLVAALAGALIAVPAFLLGRRLGGALGGLAAAAVAVTSGGSFYLSLEFVKHGVGLTVAMTALVLAARALERPERGRLIAAAAGALAAVLTHKTAAVLLALLLLPAILVELRARGVSRAAWRRLAIAAAAALAAAVVLGALLPERFVARRDLAELAGAFGGEARWSLPAMHVERPGRAPYVLAMGDQALIALGLAVAWLAAAVAARATGRLASPARPAERAIEAAAVALVLVTAIPFLAVGDPDGLGFRLRIAVFAPAAIVAAGLAGRLLHRAAWAPLVVVPLLAARLATVPAAPREGLVVAHPALVAGMYALRDRLPRGAVVITSERHLGYMAAWYARARMRMRPGPIPPERRWRLLGGARIGLGSPLDRALRDARGVSGLTPPIGLHARDPSGLVLVPEATWEWALSRIPDERARYWRAWPTI